MDKAVRVLIADDHPPTRAGVRATLEDAGFEVCCEVGDAPSAVARALEEKPDLCLLDIHMPGGGISAADKITSQLPDTAVVMLTVSRNDVDLFDSLRAGAAGYLLKDTDPDRLPIALKGVLEGEAAVPRLLVSRLIEEFRGGRTKRRLPRIGGRGVELTSREWDVLDLLKEGCSTEQISQRLFVSPGTVRSHVASMLKKLDVPTREAAVALLGDQSGTD
jgi:DNA-binding NarL/FixJ family response regulator